MNAPADSSILTKILSTGHTVHFFLHFFFLLLLTVFGVCSESIKKWKPFNFYNNFLKNDMLLRQYALAIFCWNLLRTIQISLANVPWQLSNTKANFKGWNKYVNFLFVYNHSFNSFLNKMVVFLSFLVYYLQNDA